MRMKHRKIYLVSYFYRTKDYKQGHGHTTFTVRGHGKCLMDVKSAMKSIEEIEGFKDVVLTNICEVDNN